MKKTTAYIFLPLLLAFCFVPVFAQLKGKVVTKGIDAYCKTVDAFTESSKNPQLVFADTASYEKNSKYRWKKFASAKALEKYREKSETYSIAHNWRKSGKIVRSNFTLFSPSGDWTKYVNLYFRENGTLVKAESELRTFYGDFIVLNDIYFNANGKILKKRVEYLDLETKKPKKPGGSDVADNGGNFKFTEYYKKTDKLPFAFLVK